MAAVSHSTQSPAIQDPRRRESPDVIDVDALDADDIVYVGSARPAQRRRVGEDGSSVPVTRDIIHITDSEDENEIQFIRHNRARPQPPLVTRERLFSPPPPPQIDVVPPVPRIPQRFLALRPRPSPGPIIPDDAPLPFEADLRPSPPVERPVSIAAPPSHHVPSMGFGGALLAGVRRIMGPRNTPHRLERRNSWGVSGSFVMRWDPFDFAGEEEDLLDEMHEMGYLGEEDNSLAAGRVRNQIERVFKQRDRDGRPEADYKPHYTHPDGPSPGFTHDFAPPSSPLSVTEDNSASRGASTSAGRSCEVTLVCAACRDPLILGASDVGEGRPKRKLWGLRCGHLLDGKCIEKLMKPVLRAPDAAESSSGSSPVEHPPSQSQDTVGGESDASPVRPRLRPRREVPGSFPSTPPARVTPPGGRRGARGQGSQRGSRKGKGKMKAPVVEAEHEWSCPVGGCGRVHASLLVDGRWRMEEKRGAIPVFV